MPGVLKPKIKVGLVQMETRIGGYESNIARAIRAIDDCAAAGCSLVCLPEAFSTTLDFGGIQRVSEAMPGPTSDLLCRKAREAQVFVAAGLLEKEDDRIYSTVLLIDDSGQIAGRYRRTHVFELESRFISRGDQGFEVYDTPIGRIGLLCGYDLNFPEACRSLFLKKAEIIVCPAQIPRVFGNGTRLLAEARAQESNCYFLFVSAVGENSAAGIEYMGRSAAIRSSIGLESFSTEYVEQEMVLAEADVDDTIIFAELDIRHITREQEENPHYRDRVPETYTDLCVPAAIEGPERVLMWDSPIYRKGGHRV